MSRTGCETGLANDYYTILYGSHLPFVTSFSFRLFQEFSCSKPQIPVEYRKNLLNGMQKRELLEINHVQRTN